MRKVLATTAPLQYGDLTLRKDPASLRSIAKNTSIPLTVDHGDKEIGEIRSLAYEESNGIGKLTGVVSDRILKQFKGHGVSLKYLGVIRDGAIELRKLVHATLTPTPRDNHTLVSDGEGELIEFQDSEDDAKTETTEPTEPEVPETESEGTEIEITDQVLNAIRDRLLADPVLLQRLIPTDPKTDNKTEDKEESEKESTPTEPLKIIIKPAKPQIQKTAPAPKATLQKPFRSIKK